jgi:DNA-binding phage protein
MSKKKTNFHKESRPLHSAARGSRTSFDPRHVKQSLLEHIGNSDLRAFREVLSSFIMSANKVQLSRKIGIGRRTLYDILDPEVNFNPELSTVSAIMRAFAE